MTDVAVLRAELGWSQSRLAECVGCDQSTIDRLEDGQPLRGATALVFERLSLLAKTHALAGLEPREVIKLLVGRGEPSLPKLSDSCPEPASA